MDGAIVFFISVVLCAVCHFKKGHGADAECNSEISMERIVANTALNPEMIHDEHAFMGIANELGFH